MERIGQGFSETATSLRLYAVVPWIAWVTIIYSGDCVVVPLSNAYNTTSTTFVVSTLALAIILFAAAAIPAVFDKAIMSTPVLVGTQIAAGVCTVGIAMEGALPAWLFYICAAASGGFTGILALRCAAIYAEVDTKRCIMTQCLALIVGLLVYSFATMCGFYFSPEVVLAITTPLPALGALMCSIPTDNERPVCDDATHRLVPSFWRVVVFCGLLTFALITVRGAYPQTMDSMAFSESRCIVAIGLIGAATVIGLLAAIQQRNGSFSSFFYWVLVASVAAIVPIATLGVASPVAGALGGVASGIVFVTSFCLFTGISYHSGMSTMRVFGSGFGAVSLATILGFIAGDQLNKLVDPQYIMFAGTVFLMLCLVLSVVLLRMHDFDRFTSPTPEMLAALHIEEGEETKVAGDKVDVSNEPRKPGRFMQRCYSIAEDYALSPRETDVFILLAKHMEAKTIAEELYISFNTARTHISKIYTKLGVHSRSELQALIDSYRD